MRAGRRRKINRCNYLQEHGGGAGQCGEEIAAEPYKLSACTDDSSDATVIITSLSFNAANRSAPPHHPTVTLHTVTQSVFSLGRRGRDITDVNLWEERGRKNTASRLVSRNMMDCFNNFPASLNAAVTSRPPQELTRTIPGFPPRAPLPPRPAPGSASGPALTRSSSPAHLKRRSCRDSAGKGGFSRQPRGLFCRDNCHLLSAKTGSERTHSGRVEE